MKNTAKLRKLCYTNCAVTKEERMKQKMKKIEEMLYVATESKKNTIISVAVLLLVGYILGFIGIKLI